MRIIAIHGQHIINDITTYSAQQDTLLWSSAGDYVISEPSGSVCSGWTFPSRLNVLRWL